MKQKLALILTVTLLAFLGTGPLSARPSPDERPPDFTPDRNGSDYKKMWTAVVAQIAALEETLADKNDTIADLDQQIADLEKDLADKKESSRKINERLVTCQKECEELKVSLKLKEVELADKKKVVADLTVEWGESHGRIKDLEDEIAQIKEDLAEAERKALVPHTPDWHYIDGKGWLWTSPDYFPLVYSEQNAGWLYYELGTHNPWLYYDYNSESWQEWFSN